MSGSYDEMVRLLREAAMLASAAHLMSWDQETMMPGRRRPAAPRRWRW